MGISYWSLTGGGRLQEREWRIQGAPGLLLFLDQTEARGAEKTSFGDRPPPPLTPYLRAWMTGRSPVPYLKVWISH